MSRLIVAVAFAAFLTGCLGPSVPHPLAGESRYLCCNLHYEKTKINDVNYQVGSVIPLGTHVRISDISAKALTFQPDGHPAITVLLRYGRKTIDMDTFVDRLLVRDDPRRRLPGGNVGTLIKSSRVDEGMTRKQVLMSLGYPPAHRTPSLDGPQWTYWQNRWVTFTVTFEGDRVASTTR